MKLKLLVIALLPLLFTGCLNDLFDEGDTKKIYDGPAQVIFFPQQQEVEIEEGTAEVEIQLVADAQNSDLSVSFSVDAENSDAVEGTHYNIITSSPVNIPSGSHSVNIEIELIEDSLDEGDEVELRLILEGAEGVPAAENLNTSRTFIRG